MTLGYGRLTHHQPRRINGRNAIATIGRIHPVHFAVSRRSFGFVPAQNLNTVAVSNRTTVVVRIGRCLHKRAASADVEIAVAVAGGPFFAFDRARDADSFFGLVLDFEVPVVDRVGVV